MIELIPISKEQQLREAFGLTQDEATAEIELIKKAIQCSDTWSECLKLLLEKDTAPLIEGYRLLTVGIFIGKAH